ncbi:MAG: cytochrome c oxidase subunit II [Myxococcota bacterium]
MNFANALTSLAVSAGDGSSFWFPPQASTSAETIDFVYYFIYYISIFFFVLIGGAIVYLALRYRRRSRDELALEAAGHSNTLEVTWSVIPAILCVFMFYFGTVGFMDLRTAPEDSNEVTVHGWKWAWEFEYENGGTSQMLHAVLGEPTRLVMYSDDVLHSFFIPSFRVKQDVVPGRYTSLWFEPTIAGEHQVFCTEYCGTKHSDMLAKVMVHETREQYEEAMSGLMNKYEGLSQAESGEMIYKAKGCNGCHSLDGSRLVGPSFKGLWGKERKFADASVENADENYVRNSILNPQGQVVEGYPPVMPSYKGQLTDDEIGFIIEYIKTLKD